MRAVNLFPARHLQRGILAPRRRGASRPCARLSPVPGRDARGPGAARCLRRRRRHRRGAYARRLCRAGGQHAGPVRCFVHAGLPGSHQAGASYSLPRAQGARGVRIPGTSVFHPGVPECPCGNAAGGGPDPGPVQLRVLRARVPGRPDGGRPRRGTGPGGSQRQPVRAHGVGAQAHRRRLPAHRRRLHRPGHLPRGLGPGGAGVVSRLPRRQRRPGQRPRHRCGGRQGGLRLHSRHHPVLPGRGADSGQCGYPPLPPTRGPRPYAGRPAGSRGQGGRGIRRLRHAGRAPVHGAANGRHTRPGCVRTPPTSSPSRFWPSPGRAVSSTEASSPATSTCVPSRCTDGTGRWSSRGDCAAWLCRRATWWWNSSQGGGCKDLWVLRS